jgi:hypothetical protein
MDWLLTADGTEADLPPVGFVGDNAPVIEAFRTIAERWLGTESCPPLTRLAFGSTFLEEVVSREDGYRRLDELLPALTVDPVGSRDLSYQINRPRPSRVVEGLEVNRLSTWKVGVTQMFVASPAGIVPAPQRRYFCRLDLDINSAADRTAPLPSDRLRALFSEFVALTSELLEHGERP